MCFMYVNVGWYYLRIRTMTSNSRKGSQLEDVYTWANCICLAGWPTLQYAGSDNMWDKGFGELWAWTWKSDPGCNGVCQRGRFVGVLAVRSPRDVFYSPSQVETWYCWWGLVHVGFAQAKKVVRCVFSLPCTHAYWEYSPIYGLQFAAWMGPTGPTLFFLCASFVMFSWLKRKQRFSICIPPKDGATWGNMGQR